jgi:hypothetical protein
MSVLNIFSPGQLNTGTTVTQFIPNPWSSADNPAWDVWVQCTMSAIQVGGDLSLAGIGIVEIEFVDDQGQVQRTTFGDITNLSNVAPLDLQQRLFVPQMLSVTIAMIVGGGRATGITTLFQWG